MSVSTRQVKNKRDRNGALTGKAGVDYDVNVKYQQQGKWRTHVKKGFATKKEAVQYEAEMRTKLASPSYSLIDMAKGKQTVQEYMETWVEQHGKANLRPSTFDGYKSYISATTSCLISAMCSCGRSLQLCWTTCFRRCLTRDSPKALCATPSAS